jgi:hypothetical protein
MEKVMSIQKKSLIANREAAKKAIVATKPEATTVKSNVRSGVRVSTNARPVFSNARPLSNVKVTSNVRS